MSTKEIKTVPTAHFNSEIQEAVAHKNRTDNPHQVTAEQVGAITKVQDDTSPKLGGNLNLEGYGVLSTPIDGNRVYAPALSGNMLSDYLGYASSNGGGASDILYGAWDDLAYLVEKGGSITSNPAPSAGDLSSLFYERTPYLIWNSPTYPVTITINMPSQRLYNRFFYMFFDYSGYNRPTHFKVEFFDSNNNLIDSDEQTGWHYPVYKLHIGAYHTTKIIITFYDGGTSGDLQLYKIAWTKYYNTSPIPYALSVGGGDMYGKVNFKKVINLVPQSSAPPNPIEGDLYVGTDHHIYCYLNGSWKQLD